MSAERMDVQLSPSRTYDLTDTVHLAALELGDKWVLLILLAAARGISRFDGFYHELGIARNILTHRLNKMIDADLLEKTPVLPGGRRLHYILTTRGETAIELFKLLRLATASWSRSAEPYAE